MYKSIMNIKEIAEKYACEAYGGHPTSNTAMKILQSNTEQFIIDLLVGKLKIPGYVLVSEKDVRKSDLMEEKLYQKGYEIEDCHKCQEPCMSSANEEYGQCDKCYEPVCLDCAKNPTKYVCHSVDE